MHTPLPGSHQIDNAALVLAACELLNRNSVELSLKHIRDGLSQNRWPGRLDIVSTSPLVILDGAHNLIAVRKLARYLSEKMSDRNITLVAGVMDDKSYTAMLQTLLPLCSRAILTQASIDYAVPPATLYGVAKTVIPNVEMFQSVEPAVKHALKTASPEDVILIAGSLYVVGEAKEVLDRVL